MCKVADAAMTMANNAIALANEKGASYYADFYKLHKLLYYAQGYTLTHYNKKLFEEDIEAHSCGPFIPVLLTLPIIDGFGPIKTLFPEDEICPLTDDRNQAIIHTLRIYGGKAKEELVNQSKVDDLYLKYWSKDRKNVIPTEEMRKAKDTFDF